MLPRPWLLALIAASLAVHGAALAWLALPEPAAELAPPEPLLLHLAPPEPPAEIVPEPEPEPEPTPEPEPEIVPVPDPVVGAIPDLPPDPVPDPVPAPKPLVRDLPVEPRPPVAPAVTGDPQVRAEYASLVRATLERNKRYPRRAERRRMEGECLLSLTLNRAGNVMHCALVRGSGEQVLDDAALDIVKRVGSFPPMPSDVPGDTVEFVVPIAFTLQ